MARRRSIRFPATKQHYRHGQRPASRAVPALLLVDGAWVVDPATSRRPDGYVVTNDGGETFVIDRLARRGLRLTVTDGQPEITYP